jgi:hypothetical protein
MLFTLSAFDGKSKKHVLVIEINLSSSTIAVELDSERRPAIETKVFINALNEYNKNYMDGLSYRERDFYRLLGPKHSTITIDNLIRAFAKSSAYLYLDWPFESNNLFISNKFDTMNRYFFDNSMVDWTGDLGTQPVMYFVKKSILDQHSRGILFLYEKGLLHKYEAILDEKTQFVSYYLPFDLPDVRNIGVIAHLILWRRINSEMNQELSKLNKQGLSR